MRLFCTAFLLALKHSGLRLLCLLCVFAVCASAVSGVVFAKADSESAAREKAVVAIYSDDDDLLTRQLLNTVVSSSAMSGLIEVRFVNESAADIEEYTAYIHVPAGFLASIMDGTNMSPRVYLNLEAPIAAVFVRQLMFASTSALTSAQHGIYAAQDCVDYGQDMERQRYQAFINAINVRLLSAFMNRLSSAPVVTVSASGAISMPQYYFAAITSLLLLCYAFLYGFTTHNLWRFSHQCQKKPPLFCAAAAHIFVLSLCATMLCMWASSLLGGKIMIVEACVGAVLVSAFSLMLSLVFTRIKALAAASIMLSLGLGLCSGAFMPLELMPSEFTTLSALLPSGQLSSLFASAFGDTANLAQPVIMSAIMLAVSWLLWNKRVERGGEH